MSKHTPVHGIAKGPDAVATQRAFRQLDVAIGSIEAAISTLEEQIENIQGGVGAVNSVTAGSNMVSVSPTTGDVIVNVVPANFTGIPQSAITNLEADLAGKSDVGHGHVIADVSGLQMALDGKSPVGHTHVKADVTDFAHTHPINEVTGLQTELDGKIDEVIAGTNLSGGGTSGAVTLNVVDSPTFAGNVTVSGTSTLTGHVGIGSAPHVTYPLWVQKNQNNATLLVAVNTTNNTAAQAAGGVTRTTGFSDDFLTWGITAPLFSNPAYGHVAYFHSKGAPFKVGTLDANSLTLFTNGLSNARLTIDPAGAVVIPGPSNYDVLTVTTTGTGVTTAGKALVHASRTGTFLTSIEDTSKAYGVLAEVSMSEEGSGTTRNIAGRFVAEDGDENIALELLGDVEFDYRLGGSRIYSQGGLAVDVGGTNLNLATDFASIVNINTGLGVTNVAGALNVSGNVTLGDSSGDAHVLNGTLNVNGTAGTNGQVLQIVSGVPQWGTLSSGSVSGLAAIATSGSASDLITGTVPAARMPALTGDVTSTVGTVATTIADNAVSNAKLRDSAALSVIGRSANSAGDPADIVADTDGHVLRRSGTTLGFGTIPQSSVTNLTTDLAAKLPSANVSGTSGKLAKFTSTNAIGNSIVTESGTGISVAGDVVATRIAASGRVTAGEYAFTGAVIGRLKIGHWVFTSNGTYTPTPGTKAVRLRMVSGGGGGGGVNGTSGSAAGGGGGSGGCTELWIDPGYEITSGGAVTVGAGGSGGGTIAPSTGSSGGTTSVVIDGTTYFISGGGGGAGATRGSGNVYAAGGVTGGHSGSNVTVLGGAPGHPGISLGGTFCYSGMGGSLPPWGTGGIARTGLTAGNAALGYGAGGGGASGFGGNAAGGAGAPGIVIIEEYA